MAVCVTLGAFSAKNSLIKRTAGLPQRSCRSDCLLQYRRSPFDLRQSSHTRALDRRDMDKNVRLTVAQFNKTKALG